MFNAFVKLFSGNVIGKLVGLLREVIMAAMYGTSAPVSSFRVAQTATIVPINFFTADALNAGFIPLYNKYKEENIKKAQSLFWIFKIAILIISFCVSVALYTSSSWWVGLIAPGFDSEGKAIAVNFVQIMAVGVPFYILGILYSYLAMANQSYLLASIRPTIQSIGLICGIIFSYYLESIVLLAWGFTASYIVYFIIGIIELLRKSLLQFHLQNIHEILHKIWETIKPLLILPFILQASIIVEKIIASFMGIEVVASVEYAKFITETGVVLLAVPLGLASLSSISLLNNNEIKNKVFQIVSIILIVTMPASAFLIVNSSKIISIIFERGAFDHDSVLITQSVLIGLSIGFWAQVASYVMIKALNARMRNKEVVVITAVALLVNVIFNIVFYRYLGPMTIGLGISIYGLVLFIYSLRAFELVSLLKPILIWLSIGVLVYLYINSYISSDGWVGLFVSLGVFILFWLGYVAAIPTLRSAMIPFVNRIIKI